MRAKHAAIIREGILEARYDAARLAYWYPAVAASVSGVKLVTTALSGRDGLKLKAYLRAFPVAAQRKAWGPVMEELMEEIRAES